MTATDAEPRFAVDSSVAVAALDESHAGHSSSRAAVLAHRPALAGHAAFETYSVLTRLPGVLRVAPATASAIVSRAFPRICWLGPVEYEDLMVRLGVLGIAGGAVYDALVGQAAAAHGTTLLTRDRRAERTYRLLDLSYEVIGG